MSHAAPLSPSSPAGFPLRLGLWVAQGVGGAAFVIIGLMKLTTPIPKLAVLIPWAGQLPEWFVRGIALIDIAGGLGLLLPALTRIQPRLTVLAALGCVVLQMLAISFHISRGEFNVLPLNAVLIALAAFILWGRSRSAIIAPRH